MMLSTKEDIVLPEGCIDSQYIVDNLGVPLTKALTEIILKQPLDPIEYLARWLYKYKENQSELQKEKEWQEELKVALEELARRLACEEEARQLARKREEERLRQIQLQKEKEEEELRKKLEEIERQKARKILQGKKDISGQTILHHMAGHAGADFSELYDMVELLADKDLNYRTPRDMAMEENIEENIIEIDKYVSSLMMEGNVSTLKQLLFDGYPYMQQAIDLLPSISELPEESQNFINSIADIQDRCESIFKAIQEGDEEGFFILLESMPELISCKNTRGQSLLHVAVLHEETEMIKHILETHPESHKAKDNVHRTPLHYGFGISESLINLFPQEDADFEVDALNKAPKDYLEDPTDILALKKEDMIATDNVVENVNAEFDDAKNDSE
ncbi:reticulocyte-binding protein homolog 2a [Octopus bimaculoides]|nr:reticulocyte-binding protein homolog 2a [Octopus bimaculoides]|eukprot:XP_014772839.1 PREDICTED: reticulocyte-binding protein 2 homolog a-like [Octopus bimaculoides]